MADPSSQTTPEELNTAKQVDLRAGGARNPTQRLPFAAGRAGTHHQRPGPRYIRRSTLLDCRPEEAWRVLLQPQLLLYVAWPVLQFRPVTPRQLPPTWHNGKYLVRLYVGGWLPVGRQWIVISQDAAHYTLRDNGHGTVTRRWDHHITLRAAGAGQTWYTDEVTVAAGIWTPLVAWFAAGFYWWRQRRWRRLVRHQFAY